MNISYSNSAELELSFHFRFWGFLPPLSSFSFLFFPPLPSSSFSFFLPLPSFMFSSPGLYFTFLYVFTFYSNVFEEVSGFPHQFSEYIEWKSGLSFSLYSWVYKLGISIVDCSCLEEKYFNLKVHSHPLAILAFRSVTTENQSCDSGKNHNALSTFGTVLLPHNTFNIKRSY